jgi:hypothetical protein
MGNDAWTIRAMRRSPEVKLEPARALRRTAPTVWFLLAPEPAAVLRELDSQPG